jgi:hypothetical protein
MNNYQINFEYERDFKIKRIIDNYFGFTLVIYFFNIENFIFINIHKKLKNKKSTSKYDLAFLITNNKITPYLEKEICEFINENWYASFSDKFLQVLNLHPSFKYAYLKSKLQY